MSASTSSSSTQPNPPKDFDLAEARHANTVRLRHAWEQLASRYTRGLDEDDIIDLPSLDIISDRGAVRSSNAKTRYGILAEADETSSDAGGAHTEGDDDELDEIDAFTSSSGLEDALKARTALRKALPPLRRREADLDPNDRSDLQDFLAAEQRRHEMFGNPDDDYEGVDLRDLVSEMERDEEEEEEAQVEARRLCGTGGDEQQTPPRSASRSRSRALSRTPPSRTGPRAASREGPKSIIANPAAKARGLSMTPSPYVLSLADNASEDELDGWEPDEPSYVYKPTKNRALPPFTPPRDEIEVIEIFDTPPSSPSPLPPSSPFALPPSSPSALPPSSPSALPPSSPSPLPPSSPQSSSPSLLPRSPSISRFSPPFLQLQTPPRSSSSIPAEIEHSTSRPKARPAYKGALREKSALLLKEAPSSRKKPPPPAGARAGPLTQPLSPSPSPVPHLNLKQLRKQTPKPSPARLPSHLPQPRTAVAPRMIPEVVIVSKTSLKGKERAFEGLPSPSPPKAKLSGPTKKIVPKAQTRPLPELSITNTSSPAKARPGPAIKRSAPSPKSTSAARKRKRVSSLPEESPPPLAGPSSHRRDVRRSEGPRQKSPQSLESLDDRPHYTSREWSHAPHDDLGSDDPERPRDRRSLSRASSVHNHYSDDYEPYHRARSSQPPPGAYPAPAPAHAQYLLAQAMQHLTYLISAGMGGGPPPGEQRAWPPIQPGSADYPPYWPQYDVRASPGPNRRRSAMKTPRPNGHRYTDGAQHAGSSSLPPSSPEPDDEEGTRDRRSMSRGRSRSRRVSFRLEGGAVVGGGSGEREEGVRGRRGQTPGPPGA
ncbi:hypothetical protein FA95DRAFT_1545072 [Auriscalpium vulgare]|uniref:Uncharacterized protein n=1 Tax=Auriscalpium vulgare TaxID=40419 RepID=A0ACB8RJH7_9AGAM|nr:hypothetical protein FA95DRAFT_1545072 [Auriscalpium vulgare]